MKKKRPRRRSETLSEAVLWRCATGYWWDFLAGPLEQEPSAAQIAGIIRTHNAQVKQYAQQRWPGMPVSPVLKKSRCGSAPYRQKSVRRDWLKGTWAYAIGRPAIEHPKYAEAVARAKGKFNRWWIRTWADVSAVLEGCYFDEVAALRPVVFFERFLKHSKGEFQGQPFVLLDWQRYDVIMPLFGWKRADDTRRYRRAYIEVPKKNGKSALSSGIALYMLLADNEPGAEVYAAAVAREQAAIVYTESNKMVKAAPELKARIYPVEFKKEMHHRPSGSIYKALSAEYTTHEGLNISACIVDELHAHKNRSLWGTLIFGGVARRQPLFVSITTAGVYDPISIGWEQHCLAERILSGAQESSHLFAYIAGVKEEDDWRQPAIHKRANPSYGELLTSEIFEEQVSEVEGNPSGVNEFRRYRLDVWTQAVDAYIDMSSWFACRGAIDLDALEGRPCYGGLDLSNTDDLTAFALVWPPYGEDEKWRWYVWCWAAESVIESKSRLHDVPYSAWANDGWIVGTPGNSVDYSFIRAQVNVAANRFAIREIGFDPWSARQLATELQDEDGLMMVEVRQGSITLSEPTKATRKVILDGEVVHGDNPVLTWAANNLVVRENANLGVAPDKRRSIEKIDPLVAVIIGMSRAIIHPTHDGVISVYNTEELFVI